MDSAATAGGATPIRHVTVVGGGTAGWLAAAYLNHRLQWGPEGSRDIRVVVVESPGVPSIGVGEATVPTLKATLRLLQIDEDEFVARTDATFKLAVGFENWQRPGADGVPHAYLSPFTSGPEIDGRSPAASFVAHELGTGDRDLGGTYHDRTGLVGAVLAQGRGPRRIGGEAWGGLLQYAYHLDAGRFAGFLRELCLARGVEHVADHVTGIVRDPRGLIGALTLAERGEWPTDLVIDCTGFRGTIVNELLGEPFDGWGDYLFNDRAIPLQIASPPGVIPPVTTAHALDAGWSWRIPLRSRVGTGYVFAGGFTDDAAALAELERLNGADARYLTQPRTIAMRVGRTRRSWVGNCVAIGSSAGFMEPLESTTILAIEFGMRWLIKNWPSTAMETPLADAFNRQVEQFHEEVRDYIGLHFALSDRDDTPYWRAVRHDAKRSARLEELIALWRLRLPSIDDLRPRAPFGVLAMQGALIGKRFYDGRPPAGGRGVVAADRWRRHLGVVAAQRQAMSVALPDHAALLDSIAARAVRGASIAAEPGRLPDEEALLAPGPLLTPRPAR